MVDTKAGSLTGPGRTGRTMLTDWVATFPSRHPTQAPICLRDLLNPAAEQDAGAVLDLGGNNNLIATTNKEAE